LREAAVDRSGRYLAVADYGGDRAVVIDLKDPAKRVNLSPHEGADYVAISPDGNWVVTGAWHNSEARIWNARTGELVRVLAMPGRTRAVFSPDGRWLGTSSSEYQLWSVGDWKPAGPPIASHELPQDNYLTFSPDSRMIALVEDSFKIQLLETATGKKLCTLEPPDTDAKIQFLSFNAAGTRLAAVEASQKIQLWNLPLLREQLRPMGLDWESPAFPPEDNLKQVIWAGEAK
jgi:WD40 repeat protein